VRVKKMSAIAVSRRTVSVERCALVHAYHNGYDQVSPGGCFHIALDNQTAYSTFLTERVVGIRTEGAGQTQPTGGGRGPGGGGGQAFGQGAGQGAGAFQRPTNTAARPGDASDIVGDPIGRDALISELRSEMIPYTPEMSLSVIRNGLESK
jgi:hypothetical protein